MRSVLVRNRRRDSVVPRVMNSHCLAVFAVWVGLGGGACKGKTHAEADEQSADVPAAPAAVKAPVEKPAEKPAERPAGRPEEVEVAAVKVEVQAALDRWVSVQTARDFEGYGALYEPRTFRGVKRTA